MSSGKTLSPLHYLDNKKRMPRSIHSTAWKRTDQRQHTARLSTLARRDLFERRCEITTLLSNFYILLCRVYVKINVAQY